MMTAHLKGLLNSSLRRGFERHTGYLLGMTRLSLLAILGRNEKIMAARCVGKAIYLALDISQLALSAVFCVILWVSADCLWASWCFLVRTGQVQMYSTKANTAL